jgi:hypothetical protein
VPHQLHDHVLDQLTAHPRVTRRLDLGEHHFDRPVVGGDGVDEVLLLFRGG